MLRTEPLSEDNWNDFVALCHEMGPNRSCWCLWWRERPGRQDGTARSRAEALVRESGHPLGALAYEAGAPVGWVAVSPRSEYPRLNAGRTTAPLGSAEGTWAVPCFFVVPPLRGKGVARALLGAALDLARSEGARWIEGVPGDPATKDRSPSASYTGTVALFRAAGFTEVARRTPKGRVLMRLDLAEGSGRGRGHGAVRRGRRPAVQLDAAGSDAEPSS